VAFFPEEGWLDPVVYAHARAVSWLPSATAIIAEP
jgi:hypothetical protein